MDSWMRSAEQEDHIWTLPNDLSAEANSSFPIWGDPDPIEFPSSRVSLLDKQTSNGIAAPLPWEHDGLELPFESRT